MFSRLGVTNVPFLDQEVKG